MTTPTRLAEIAEREAFIVWINRIVPVSPAMQEQWSSWQAEWRTQSAQLTAAQERERMDAEIMREAAERLENHASHPLMAMCLLCPGVANEGDDIAHTSDCLVTKLRERADQLGGAL